MSGSNYVNPSERFKSILSAWAEGEKHCCLRITLTSSLQRQLLVSPQVSKQMKKWWKTELEFDFRSFDQTVIKHETQTRNELLAWCPGATAPEERPAAPGPERLERLQSRYLFSMCRTDPGDFIPAKLQECGQPLSSFHRNQQTSSVSLCFLASVC